VAAKGLKVAVFSIRCREVVRVARKGVVEKRLKVDPWTPLKASSLKLKRERLGDGNTETQSARTEGRESWVGVAATI
jgi:hypothetical protein